MAASGEGSRNVESLLPGRPTDGRSPSANAIGEIYVMNADGSERRRLTQDGESPAWSPDGKMIAFDRHLATGEELYVMTADGRGERRLMRSDRWVGFGNPDPWWAWSPTPKRQ